MGLRFVVIGAGSVGGVISALLQKAGHGVTVIARGAHLDAIRHNGLVLETPRGNRRAPAAGSGASGRCPPEQVTRSPARQGWRRSSWGSVELSEELRLGDRARSEPLARKQIPIHGLVPADGVHRVAEVDQELPVLPAQPPRE